MLVLGFSRFFHCIIQNGEEVVSVFKNYCVSAGHCHTVKHLPWGEQNVAWCLLFCPLKVPVFCICCFLEVSLLLLFLSLPIFLFKIVLYCDLERGGKTEL